MDSITQIVLGASVAALAAPARHRRSALLAGAVLGTLPDLDSIPLVLMGADPVTLVTWHRGPSHSLFVLAAVGWLLWLALRHWWQPVREAPRRWLLAIQAALLTHPLLDAFTVYGTQLWWPLPTPPVMISSVFIIDPVYTLPLAVGCWLAWKHRAAKPAQTALWAGVALSTLYLGWSLGAKAMVDHAARQELAARGLPEASLLSVPMPFTTLLWRVVAMTPDGYLEGEYSLLADRGPTDRGPADHGRVPFRHYPSDVAALAAVADYPAVARLRWFTHGFLKAEQRDGRLVLSDLRMGLEPDYNFRYAVAASDGSGGWRDIAVERAQWSTPSLERLPQLWRRLWQPPAAIGESELLPATHRAVP